MVIIEGPDGAGKTTLINHILRSYPELRMAPRACTSMGGPLTGHDLAYWLRYYGTEFGAIYDRHPSISGPVYDAVFGRTIDDVTADMVRGALHYITENARVIYCRPPRREIVKSVNESAQMGGVDREIHRIIDTYDAIMSNMIRHEVYDWTRDELPSL